MPLVVPLVMLALLAGPWLVARALGAAPARRRALGRLGIALLFCFTGIGHFAKTDGMVAMLPELLPARRELVLASGVVEILLGLAAVLPRTSRVASLALCALLVLFLPVNARAAWNRVPIGGHELGPAYLLLRVPLQARLFTWVAAFGVRRHEHGER
jgi:uncharacterized membrane protein